MWKRRKRLKSLLVKKFWSKKQYRCSEKKLAVIWQKLDSAHKCSLCLHSDQYLELGNNLTKYTMYEALLNKIFNSRTRKQIRFVGMKLYTYIYNILLHTICNDIHYNNNKSLFHQIKLIY